MSKITLVTGLWDIGRNNLNDGWSRSYETYLEKFSQLLQLDINLIIYGDESLRDFVFSKRDTDNTQFVVRDNSWFIQNDY